jgi:hypothetical protein
VLSFRIGSSREENHRQKKETSLFTSHRGERAQKKLEQGRKRLRRLASPHFSGVPYPRLEPPADRGHLDGGRRPAERHAKSRRARGTRRQSF